MSSRTSPTCAELVPSAAATQHKSRNAILVKGRRRSRKACIGCRQRKVRCDVTMRGVPCTNCQLDCKSCEVKDRASRRPLPTSEGIQHMFDSYVLPSREECEPESPAWGLSMGLFDDELEIPVDTPSVSTGNHNQKEFIQQPSPAGVIEAESGHGATPRQISYQTSDCTPVQETLPAPSGPSQPTSHVGSGASPTSEEVSIPPPRQGIGGYRLIAEPLMVSYSSYPFLTIGSLTDLSSEDVAFLDLKGAFRIPAKPILDEFLRHYFLHVHPIYPLIDEGKFWNTYRQDKPAGAGDKIPLLLFQAMIFASSSYLPLLVIKSMGYVGIRSARSAFYHKSKLLYDFSTEKASTVVAQAAVLMSLWCTSDPSPVQPNAIWHQIAIQHARAAHAHLAWDPPVSIARDDTQPQQEYRMLRRLWWCCVVRDRVLAVGLRRSPLIANSQPTLLISDFDSEIGRSEVIDSKTQRSMALIFMRVMHLCNILPKLLQLGPSYDHTELQGQSESTLMECRASLRDWFVQTKIEIDTTNCNIGLRHHSTIVHTNHMYIFYYACLSLLSRQEALLNCSQPQTPTPDLPSNSERGHEIQEAALGIVECCEELTQLDLTRYLPISALALISIPLLFHLLDAKFLYSENRNPDIESRHHRLQVLINTIKEYRLRYDGVEWISFTLHYVVDLAQPQLSLLSRSSVASWTDLSTQEPTFCLVLTLTVVLSLSQFRIPEDRDFPVSLRGVLRPEAGPVRELALYWPCTDRRPQKPAARATTDFELVAMPPSSMRNCPRTFSQQKRRNCPQTHLSEHVCLKDILATEDGNVSNQDEHTIVQELLSSFPELTKSSEVDGQFRSLIDPNEAQLFMEPFDVLSYDELISSECDSDTLTPTDFATCSNCLERDMLGM